jgi:integrase
MKISITTKECKSKSESALRKGNLCFRLRDKGVDVKVRSDIEVLLDFWDNDNLSYKRTKQVPLDEQKRTKELVRSITTTLSEEYDATTADVTWMRNVIDKCADPVAESKESLSTVISRMEQYVAEHPMSPKSALVYKPTIKKLQRYEAYKREMEGKDGFTLYCETIRPEDYLDFREYVINEHLLYKDYPEFYEQFSIGVHPPRQLSSTQLIGIMHHLRIVGHWCIKMGFTTNRSCDAFTIPSPVQGSPFYLTIEERDKVFHADLSHKPELEIYRDLFIFQSMVGCRVGDMFSFTRDNIVGDMLQYLPHKTMRKRPQTVNVPLTSKAIEILKRYEGRQKTLLPTKQIYQYNKGIRAVLRECGINRTVTILDTVTGQEVQKPICDVASSHMARRNFIGNLYKKVKDPELVSSMTGHVNGSRAFARYREIDEETKVNLVNLIN